MAVVNDRFAVGPVPQVQLDTASTSEECLAVRRSGTLALQLIALEKYKCELSGNYVVFGTYVDYLEIGIVARVDKVVREWL